MENQQPKKPEKKFRAGTVTATVWKNTGKNEKGEETEYRTVTIERSYTVMENGKEEWKTTSSMRQNDLPKCEIVSRKAFEYLVLKEE